MSTFGIIIVCGITIVAIVGSIITALANHAKPDSSLELPGFDFSAAKADEIRRNYW